MLRRLATIYLLTLILTWITPSPAKAQNSFQESSLKGISALFVDVEYLPVSAKPLGLTKETIQTDVELKLRLAGMRVVALGEGVKLPGSPYLYVNVNLTADARAGSVNIDLEQDALLQRNGEFATAVTTWHTGALMTNPTAQDIRAEVKDVVDKFLNDWLSVNPKK